MSQNPLQPKPETVHVKFNVDDSSKDAVEKLKTAKFTESVKEDSERITRKNRQKP